MLRSSSDSFFAPSPQKGAYATMNDDELNSTVARLLLELPDSGPRPGSNSVGCLDEPSGPPSFLERMTGGGRQMYKRNMAALQRKVIREGRAQDDVEFWGDKGVQGFRTYLEKKFGSVYAGWRELDRDKNGHLSHGELVVACRKMGYHGNLKKLWRELDVDNNGCVSIMELDPEVALYIGTFKIALIRAYGDMLTAWRKGIDTNGNGRIEQREITACCERLGLPLDPKRLFNMLRLGPKDQGITLKEFDPDTYGRCLSGDTGGFLSKGGATGSVEFLGELEFGTANGERSTAGAARKFRQQLKDQDRDKIQQSIGHNQKNNLGLHTVSGFKGMLIKRCGSLLGGWRYALDLDGNGRLTPGEFSCALNRLGVHGNIQGLYQKLDKKGLGYITFRDLDPETDALLVDLHARLVEKYGSLMSAWLKSFDRLGNGTVNEAQFSRACSEAGFAGDAAHLFRLLRPDAGRNFICLEDFDTKTYWAHLRGDFRAMDEKGHKPDDRSQLEMSFEDRMYQGFRFQLQRGDDAAMREEFAKACRVNNPDFLIDTKEEFAALCERKYGTRICAWRNCLDIDANGKLTFGEFCRALRFLGYAGDFKKLFHSLDKDRKGHVSLNDIDPEANLLVTTFLRLISEQYGGIERAWKIGFRKDPHGSMDEGELKVACKQLGFPYEARKLFKLLQPVPGRKLITIWDLDPLCARERQRGHSTSDGGSAPSKPKPAPGSLGASKSASSLPPLRSPAHESELSQEYAELATGRAISGSSPSTCGKPSACGKSKPLTASATTILSETPLLEQLRSRLRYAYPSSIAAWRGVFDPQNKGTVGFVPFIGALKRLLFHGDSKRLWIELSGDKGNVCLRDVDADSVVLIDTTRGLLLEKFGSLLAAWRQGFDVEGRHFVDMPSFVLGCKRLGLGKKRADLLFKSLLGYWGQRSLFRQDFGAFLIGVDPEFRSVVWAGEAVEGCEATSDDAAAQPSCAANAEDAAQRATSDAADHSAMARTA